MDYKAELANAINKYKSLETQKAAIEMQMQGMVQVIEGLQVLARGDEALAEVPALDLEGVGFTDAILSVLEHSGPSTPVAIRDSLQQYGYGSSNTFGVDPEASRKNLLISIHTVLRRLIKAGKVDEVTRGEKTQYQRVRTHGLPPPPGINLGWGQPDELPPPPAVTLAPPPKFTLGEPPTRESVKKKRD